MTDRKQALIDLRDKVKAGDHRVGMWQALFDPMHPHLPEYARQAFLGSLNAAKALHDAVLPGWDIQIVTYEHDSFESSVAHPLRVKSYYGVSEYMARAWLLAILEALISEYDT